MKHKAIIYLMVMLLAACSSSDEDNTALFVEDPVAVTFSTDVNAATTRVTLGSIDNIEALQASGDGFGVFAYLTDADNWTGALTADADLSDFTNYFMYNQQVTWGVQYVENDGDDDPSNDVRHYDWVYYPLKYWPNSTENATNRYVSFYAYAPYVAEGGSDGITGFTDSSDKLPHIKYEIAGGNEQVDLLYANCIDAIRNGNGLITADNSPLEYQKVPLTFKHALAAIDIYVQRVFDEPVYTAGNNLEHADDTKIYISNLELASAVDGEDGLQTGGRLNLKTGEWTSIGTAWTDATGKKLNYTESMFDDFVKGTSSDDPLVIRDTELGKFGEESGVDEEERILIKDAMPQVFLPRQVTLIPKISYSMVTKDNDLAIGYYTDLGGNKYARIVNEVVGNSMTLDFQAGKRYKMLIRIGVEHVTFEVTNIVDWDFPLRYNPSVVAGYETEHIGHRVDEP